MKIVITAFVALVLAIPGALGAEKVFWGASGAAWEVDGNWSDGMVPTAADDVRIPADVGRDVFTGAETRFAAKLFVDSTGLKVFFFTPLRKRCRYDILHTNFLPCSGGEIGRHVCLRCIWRDPCGFESRPEHQLPENDSGFFLQK